MRARARVAGGKDGGSVYRTGEWNEEVKLKPRAFGLQADLRHQPVRRGDAESVKSLAAARSRSRPSFGLRADSPPVEQRRDDPAENLDVASRRELAAAAEQAIAERFAPPPSLRKAVKELKQSRVAPAEDEPAPVAAAAAVHSTQAENPSPAAAGKQYEPSRRLGLSSEFTNTPLIPPPPQLSTDGLPQTFSSPPLMHGLALSAMEVLGPDAQPTAIQQLSMHSLVAPPYTGDVADTAMSTPTWQQALLASETGSGKTLAYLLPVLHGLKHTELHPPPPPYTQHEHRSFPMTPRALVLAPTHELARQLATSAKALSHNIKLRILCASRANKPSSGGPGSRLRDMDRLGQVVGPGGELVITRENAADLGLGMAKTPRGIDVITATPAGVLELIRGNGWERAGEIIRDDQGREIKQWEVGPRMMGLSKVEWVVVDEADILLDPDFREHTLAILDEVAAARAHWLPPSSKKQLPYNLILNSATIPGLLSATIDERWPGMQRLASPGVHKLPGGMRTEHVSASGNRMADVAERIKRIWAEDGRTGGDPAYGMRASTRLGGEVRSKVLVFVNKGTKAAELNGYLSAKGIANIVLTGTHGRAKGSNRHLAGFLNAPIRDPVPPEDEIDVLITTSLLSRGLDFSPRVRHVLVVDEPRNVVDLLHRAGRSARAGHEGTLTVFGKGPKGAKEIGGAVRRLEAGKQGSREVQKVAREPRPWEQRGRMRQRL
ncbi:P-loop containing nucleoside triphosphate hydrolase protein [Exidia glandulosa HHB12029]|uniref:p-loop containing nucleoside triphosphate hydrolase protein n=1 Tax=Exidia glandulosa HHB12029 TaxID=1314781 RepID=A0A165NFT2_EXIGL|nr:P-loop containing nucleoside triphosphate hydrolase protein [Exidia glandulosa HHB12029]